MKFSRMNGQKDSKKADYARKASLRKDYAALYFFQVCLFRTTFTKLLRTHNERKDNKRMIWVLRVKRKKTLKESHRINPQLIALVLQIL